MTIYRIEHAGTGGCPEREYPLFADDVCVGCFMLPKQAAAAARDMGATEIDAFSVDNPNTDERHALKLKPDGLWCHSFSNM